MARLLSATAKRGQGEPPAKLREALGAVAEPFDPADPVRVTARRLLGVLAYEAGELEPALAHLEVADAASPTALTRPLRAAICVALGRPREAAELLAGLDAPEARLLHAPEARLLHAHALAATGLPDVARTRLEAVVDPAGGASASVRTAAHRLLARIDADAGHWASALAHVDAAALGHQTPPVEIWVDRALCLAHLGRVDEGRVVLGGALREAPEDPRAKALKEMLR